MTDTKSDRITATEIATAISRNNCPTSSSMTRIGMKTMTVVSADTRTAPQTWLAPWNAASLIGMPPWRSRKMFSKTTIAASTTMPTAKARPASEITLIDRPIAAIATKEPMTETGMARETTKVAPMLRRNSMRTIAARPPPI